jgi:hypothetical protein
MVTRKRKEKDPRDPPVKANGKCFTCGNTRPALAVAVKDPFCSANCCRTYYDYHYGYGAKHNAPKS